MNRSLQENIGQLLRPHCDTEDLRRPFWQTALGSEHPIIGLITFNGPYEAFIEAALQKTADFSLSAVIALIRHAQGESDSSQYIALNQCIVDLITTETTDQGQLHALVNGYQALTSSEATAFRELGVSAPTGHMNMALLQHIWAISSAEQTHALAESLVQRGLLFQNSADITFTHDLAQHAYAQLLLRESPSEGTVALIRYADEVLAQMAQFEVLRTRPDLWGSFEPVLLPHMREVGNRLAEQISLPSRDSEILSRTRAFALAAVPYRDC